jgi:hypothetical protein
MQSKSKPIVAIDEAERTKKKAAAEKKRDKYILKATKAMKSLQQEAEDIVKKCQEILSKCDTTRGDIALFNTLDLHNEDGDMMFEDTAKYLYGNVQDADEADKEVIALSM